MRRRGRGGAGAGAGAAGSGTRGGREALAAWALRLHRGSNSSILLLLASFSSFPLLSRLLLSLSLHSRSHSFSLFPLEAPFSRYRRSLREHRGNLPICAQVRSLSPLRSHLARSASPFAPSFTCRRSLHGAKVGEGSWCHGYWPRRSEQPCIVRPGFSACPYGAGRWGWAPGREGATLQFTSEDQD